MRMICPVTDSRLLNDHTVHHPPYQLDSVEFTSQRRAVAEQLFDVLSNPQVQRRRLPVLLVCNKSERITAHPVDFIRKRLEKEIDSLRATSGTLEDTSGKGGAAPKVGRTGEEFQFAHLANKVSAVSLSVTEGELDEVKGFIVKVL